jgi:SpoVK/Ycf46/Vps4 family AAA+-type ATPase
LNLSDEGKKKTVVVQRVGLMKRRKEDAVGKVINAVDGLVELLQAQSPFEEALNVKHPSAEKNKKIEAIHEFINKKEDDSWVSGIHVEFT